MTLSKEQSLFDEAATYALRMFSDSECGWDAITEPYSVARAIELLAAEYRDSLLEGRGMDPEEVRFYVQTVLDAAKFTSDNQPHEYDPEAPEKPVDPDLRVFKYVSKRKGRPVGRKYDDTAIAYVIGAVAGRFGLPVHPTFPSLHGHSAIEAVAEAQRRRQRQPASIDAVRHAAERASWSGRIAEGEGYLAGLSEGEQMKLAEGWRKNS